jgi:basic membrane protein A
MLKYLLVAIAVLLSFAANGEAYRVGLLLDKAGKDDQSFNASAYRGAIKAEKELGISLKTVEARDAAAAESLLRAMAGKKYNLMIAVGFSHAGAVTRAAKLFEDRKFVIIDSEVNKPNVTSVMFAEHEGSYLVGAMAAMASKNHHVGFIGGMDIPLIRRFAMGYVAGAKSKNPNIKVDVTYIGVTGDAFNNPPKAKELALLQHQSGADVIFHAAGSSGNGLFDAAEERKFLAIGVDSNQNGVKPGVVLTSMVKSVDVAVYNAIKQALAGDLMGGAVVTHGFSTGGIDMAIDQNNDRILTKEMRVRADEIKADVISGKVVVPDYYKVKQ